MDRENEVSRRTIFGLNQSLRFCDFRPSLKAKQFPRGYEFLGHTTVNAIFTHRTYRFRPNLAERENQDT